MPHEAADGPRYGPAQRLLRMALLLAASRVGLSIEELARELDISRKTAERMRSAVAEEFPALEYRDGEDRIRRWRLPAGLPDALTAPRPEVVAALQSTARDCDARAEADRAALLREAADSLLVRLSPKALLHAEPDIEALMEAEGLALRPGPRPAIRSDVLPSLRHAIVASRMVDLLYQPASGDAYHVTVHPYGVLCGGRGWLVAQTGVGAEMRLWRLDRIREANELEQHFPPRDFDLRAYAAESFGSFHEPPIDVVLRIIPEAAEAAATWVFHPSQRTEREADGSLLVRFHAGGADEMCWHFFTWGDALAVVSPTDLRERLADMARRAARHHGGNSHTGEEAA